MDVISGECLRVDADTELRSPQELIDHEMGVIAADWKEIANFVDHGVLKHKKFEFCEVHPIDCVWIRKWKWKTLENGKQVRVIKSRLCCRGFLDPQKHLLSKNSSTAT